MPRNSVVSITITFSITERPDITSAVTAHPICASVKAYAKIQVFSYENKEVFSLRSSFDTGKKHKIQIQCKNSVKEISFQSTIFTIFYRLNE